MGTSVTDDTEVWLPGNVSGAMRVGDTVHRETGAWTPAVHALLRHLESRVPHIPRVLGLDDRGREVLSYLPGRVIDTNAELMTHGQLDALVRWTRTFHDAVAGFTHPGPWRYFDIADATLIGHNDIAAYNACFDGDRLVGVFDWDMSGPSTPTYELAFTAWNCVPLWRDIGAGPAARRLTVMADGYGGGIRPREILAAVVPRIQLVLDGIPVAAAAGDPGMVRLMALGEPDRSRRSLLGLMDRLPAIDRLL